MEERESARESERARASAVVSWGMHALSSLVRVRAGAQHSLITVIQGGFVFILHNQRLHCGWSGASIVGMSQFGIFFLR